MTGPDEPGTTGEDTQRTFVDLDVDDEERPNFPEPESGGAAGGKTVDDDDDESLADDDDDEDPVA